MIPRHLILAPGEYFKARIVHEVEVKKKQISFCIRIYRLRHYFFGIIFESHNRMHRAIRAKYCKTVTLIIILDYVKKLSRYSTIYCAIIHFQINYRIRTIFSPFYLIYVYHISIRVAISRILNSYQFQLRLIRMYLLINEKLDL